MFHIELRQFPHTARAYNLSGDELHARFVAPWARGQTVECDELRFSPERGRLTILEGRRLETDELGFGRGWGNATRTAQDVTDRELGTASTASAATTGPRGAVAALKGELAALCEVGTVSVPQALALAGRAAPTARLSARLATAEQAVWELLHEGRVRLVHSNGGEPVAKGEWEEALLAPATWFESPPRLLLDGGGGKRGDQI